MYGIETIAERWFCDFEGDFMSTVREYCEKLTTGQLKAILRADCEGRNELEVDALLDICSILAEREPCSRDA